MMGEKRNQAIHGSTKLLLLSALVVSVFTLELHSGLRLAPVSSGTRDNFPTLISIRDTESFLAIRSVLSHPILDVFFASVTVLGGFTSAVFTCWLLFLEGYRRESGEALIALLLATLATSVLKSLVGRPRPFATIDKVHPIIIEDGSSFPSGHTLRAFSLVTVWGDSWKGRKSVAYVISALIGLSRIYLGVHYPLDVLGGMAIGWSLGWLVRRLKTRPEGAYRRTAELLQSSAA